MIVIVNTHFSNKTNKAKANKTGLGWLAYALIAHREWNRESQSRSSKQ